MLGSGAPQVGWRNTFYALADAMARKLPQLLGCAQRGRQFVVQRAPSLGGRWPMYRPANAAAAESRRPHTQDVQLAIADVEHEQNLELSLRRLTP